MKGISKISVQTGTTHGGVPLADGSVAKVKLDFETLEKLSAAARADYGLAGAVQHGASTLPDEAFDRFPATGTAEIHLATGFQNIVYDSPNFPPRPPGADLRLPEAGGGLRAEGGGYGGAVHLQDPEEGVGPLQERTVGPAAGSPGGPRQGAGGAVRPSFRKLNVGGTLATVNRFVPPVDVPLKPPAGLA